MIQRKLQQWGEDGGPKAGHPVARQPPEDSNKNLDAEKRKFVLKELLQTEQEYVKKLKVICEVIEPHAREAQYLPNLVAANLDVVFGNIDAIYEFHKDMLLPDMEQMLRGRADGYIRAHKRVGNW